MDIQIFNLRYKLTNKQTIANKPNIINHLKSA